MAVIVEHRYPDTLHPLHAVILAGALPLFVGALLSDIAYARSYEIQWNNFASWLVTGGLVLAGIAIGCAAAGMFRAVARTRRRVAYLVVLVIAWIVQFFNALMHARDAWASMPGGLVLSVIGTVLVAIAVGLGFWTQRDGGRP